MCRRFNNIVHLTPYFWTCIRVEVHPSNIRRRIKLSKAASLAIAFDTLRNRPISQKKRENFFSEIEHIITRWHEMTISKLDRWDAFISEPWFSSLKRLNVASVDASTLRSWNCSFPMLERLVFRPYYFIPTHTAFPCLQSCDISTFIYGLKPLRDFLRSISSITALRTELYSSSRNMVALYEESRNLGQLCLPQLTQR